MEEVLGAASLLVETGGIASKAKDVANEVKGDLQGRGFGPSRQAR